MRRDGSHVAALPDGDQRDPGLVSKMAKLKRFHVKAVRLLGLRCAEDRCTFEVRLTVVQLADGRGHSGLDRGVVERGPDGWRVSRPPS